MKHPNQQDDAPYNNHKPTQHKRATTALPAQRNLLSANRQLSDRERLHDTKKQELVVQEKSMITQYEKLKLNLERMSKNQLNMMKIQELRQKQHKLEMEEAKLNMINASQQAVSLVDTMTSGKAGGELAAAASHFDGNETGQSSVKNMEELKESIKKARNNLANEEVHLKDSIQTFEKSLNQTFNTNEASH